MIGLGKSAITVDRMNGRYFAWNAIGTKHRLTWGGRRSGYPDVLQAWVDACKWANIAPSANALLLFAII